MFFGWICRVLLSMQSTSPPASDFFCQRCRKPVKVDDSLLGVDESLINMAKTRWKTSSSSSHQNNPSPPVTPSPIIGSLPNSSLSLRSVSSMVNISSLTSMSEEFNQSFVQPQPNSPTRQSLLERMFELASDATRIDHPLCIECAQLVIHELNRQVNEAEMDLNRARLLLDELDQEQALIDQEAQIDAEISEVIAGLFRFFFICPSFC